LLFSLNPDRLKKLFSILVILLISLLYTRAQFNELRVKGIISAYLSMDTVMPFWMISNTYGKVPNHPFVQLLELGIYSKDNKLSGNFKFDYGLEFIWTYAGISKLKTQEYYIRLKYKPVLLRIGAIQDSLRFDGMSSTNGNILYSNNYRPMPGIEFATDGWYSVPFTRDYIKLNLLYSESLTQDIRYVEGTRVHRKYVYGLFGGKLPVNLYFGLNHSVQWGGVSRDTAIGDQNPKSIKDYILTIFPTSGTDSTNLNDYLNARGNHLGGYDFGFIYRHKGYIFQLYHTTIAEDHSGLQLKNWRDGITGLYIGSEKSGLISSFLYEFYYTLHQGGDRIGEFNGKFYTGRDNYFNNTIYKSGWTHFFRTIGSPFFTVKPTLKEEYCQGIQNNRFVVHHFGISGKLNEKLTYKALFSASRNYGTYAAPYKDILKNVYSDLFLEQTFKTLPGVCLHVEFSVDFIGSITNRWGCMFGVSYQ